MQVAVNGEHDVTPLFPLLVAFFTSTSTAPP